MTFEEYLKETGYSKFIEESLLNSLSGLAEIWYRKKIKSMRSKGANTTNTKYSKEQRSEWAKRGTKARLQRKLNK